jgi:serine/threonine protein phosphatase PrpC
MNVAISGDRSMCLTHELGEEAYLFAVANGFGAIDGTPIAPLVLARLRTELDRRSRGARLTRMERRPKGMTSILAAAIARINAEIHARSASHQDYVTAGCSLIGAIVVANRAYLAHVGSTAAYLSRDGYVVSLTKNDVFESDRSPASILLRAIGAASSLEPAVCSFTLNEGDALVLSGRRLHEADERRRLAEMLGRGSAAKPGEQLLIVRYEDAHAAPPPAALHAQFIPSAVTGIAATLAFYALLCLR